MPQILDPITKAYYDGLCCISCVNTGRILENGSCRITENSSPRIVE